MTAVSDMVGQDRVGGSHSIEDRYYRHRGEGQEHRIMQAGGDVK